MLDQIRVGWLIRRACVSLAAGTTGASRACSSPRPSTAPGTALRPSRAPSGPTTTTSTPAWPSGLYVVLFLPYISTGASKTTDPFPLGKPQFGQVSNLITHLNLRSLRPAGTKTRQIPRGYGFNLVSCPNYFFESIVWVAFTALTQDYAGKSRGRRRPAGVGATPP